MKKIILLMLFISVYSIADESTYYNYFKAFTIAFSKPTISEADYSKLSSYKLEPVLFTDFDKLPPEPFGYTDKQNSNVIFNGETSRRYFIKFVNDTVLSGGTFNENGKKGFTNKLGTYSFELKMKKEQVVILEDILITAPEDMTSEMSCSYTFVPISTGQIKLTDVICAG